MARRTTTATLTFGVARRRRYWRSNEAEVVLSTWESSGENLVEFGRKHGLGVARLRHWCARLRAGGLATGTGASGQAAETLTLVPLQVSAAPVPEREEGSEVSPTSIQEMVAATSAPGGRITPAVSVRLRGSQLDILDPSAVRPDWVAELVLALQGGRS